VRIQEGGRKDQFVEFRRCVTRLYETDRRSNGEDVSADTRDEREMVGSVQLGECRFVIGQRNR